MNVAYLDSCVLKIEIHRVLRLWKILSTQSEDFIWFNLKAPVHTIVYAHVTAIYGGTSKSPCGLLGDHSNIQFSWSFFRTTQLNSLSAVLNLSRQTEQVGFSCHTHIHDFLAPCCCPLNIGLVCRLAPRTHAFYDFPCHWLTLTNHQFSIYFHHKNHA